jgi:Bbp16-like protein
MILDALLAFDTNYVMLAGTTGTVGAHSSTNQIDLGVGTVANPAIPSFAQGGGARDIGIGDKPAMKLLVQVSVTMVGATATLRIDLQGAVDNGAGAPAAFVTWWSSPAYAVTALNAGSRLFEMDMPRPPDGVAIPRFLQLNYQIATAALSAGALQSYIVIDRDDQPYQGLDNSIQGGYPAGIVVAN